MKLSQFRALCVREWEQENSRGDVTALHLTDASFAELEREAIMDGEPGPFALYIDKADLPAVTAVSCSLPSPTRSRALPSR